MSLQNQPRDHLGSILKFISVSDLDSLIGGNKAISSLSAKEKKERLLQNQKQQWSCILEDMGNNFQENERRLKELDAETFIFTAEEEAAWLEAYASVGEEIPPLSKEERQELLTKHAPQHVEFYDPNFQGNNYVLGIMLEDTPKNNYNFGFREKFQNDESIFEVYNSEEEISISKIAAFQKHEGNFANFLRVFARDPDRFRDDQHINLICLFLFKSPYVADLKTKLLAAFMIRAWYAEGNTGGIVPIDQMYRPILIQAVVTSGIGHFFDRNSFNIIESWELVPCILLEGILYNAGEFPKHAKLVFNALTEREVLDPIFAESLEEYYSVPGNADSDINEVKLHIELLTTLNSRILSASTVTSKWIGILHQKLLKLEQREIDYQKSKLQKIGAKKK